MVSLQTTFDKRSLQVKAFALPRGVSPFSFNRLFTLIHTHYGLFITRLFHSKSDRVSASLPDLAHRTRRKRCLEAAPLRDLTLPFIANSDPLGPHSAFIRARLLPPHMPA